MRVQNRLHWRHTASQSMTSHRGFFLSHLAEVLFLSNESLSVDDSRAMMALVGQGGVEVIGQFADLWKNSDRKDLVMAK